MTSFTVKRLRATLILTGANTVFPGTNSNTLIVENLKIAAKVQQVARLATQADIRIFGMRESDMTAVSVIWANPPVVLDNVVILEADNGLGFVQVFKGTITEGQADYNASPNVSFNLLAVTGYFHKISAAEPTSYPADTDINAVCGDIARRMGFTFVNGGATGVFSEGAYFWGTLWDQLAQACQAVNVDFYVQGEQIFTTPGGRPGKDQPAVVLSKDSGLVGYPVFERSGLLVRALFDPAFTCGVPIEVQSRVPNATGRWYPYTMLHVLETLTVRGQWLTQMQCLRVLV